MKRATALLCIAGLSFSASAGEVSTTDRGTVLGPENPDLTEGASHLRLGRPETGIKLTQRGLLQATTTKQQYIAYSNLCAGYILVDDLHKAIDYCDRALLLNDRNHHALSNRALARFYLKEYELAKQDVAAGMEIAPYSRSLKRVGQMIEDVLNPVSPQVTIEHSQDDGET
jgi:tetratricopeptide (TPR) repeat protein